MIYPDNPCLFTPGIRIYNHNLKIKALKEKYLKEELDLQKKKMEAIKTNLSPIKPKRAAKTLRNGFSGAVAARTVDQQSMVSNNLGSQLSMVFSPTSR